MIATINGLELSMSAILSGTMKIAGWTLAAAVVAGVAVSSHRRAPVNLSPPPQEAAPRPAAPTADFQPVPAPAFGPEVELRAGPGGNFHTTAEIEGMQVPMVVDTGASMVVLSFEQADRLGIRPFPADFRLTSQTANGRIRLAQVTLPSVRVGGIEVRDVIAAVAPEGAVGREGLLGMTFLGRLRSYQVDSGRLILRN